MNILSYSIGYLILGIFVINFLVILITRSEARLLITAVSLWTLMFLTVIILTMLNNNTVDVREIEYSGPITMTEKEFEELDGFKQQSKQENKRLVRLLGIQTMISFIWLLLGLRTNTKKYYRSTLLSFAVFSFIYGIIELIWLME
ncbi:MAG: hypothetical protein ACXWV9_07870 [Flavisolibacter sp.]